MNWRKPVIYLLLRMTRSKIPLYYNEITKIEKSSFEEKKNYQIEKLKKILKHSYEKVPYYRKILSSSEVVVDDQVNLDNFHKIPLLTKEIIRQEGKNLYADDYQERNPYENTSGGSTGEPVRFIQDNYYNQWNIATKIYFNHNLGKTIGEKEIKLWGSDRDILEGNLTVKDRIINYLYNRKFFNCYNFTEEDMIRLVNLNNSFKPTAYWAYVDALIEFSKYVNKNQTKLFKPKFIVSTIGPLDIKNRNAIEKAFGCKVYNQYGSREVGVIACQNIDQNELDVFYWRQFIEIIPVKNSKDTTQGKIVVTSLDNYSMPLIRYELGDIAIKGEKSYDIGSTKCYFSLKDIIGRTLGYFKLKDGSLKHTHFLVQQLFFQDWIKKFQVIQRDFDWIEIRIVGYENKEAMETITNNIKFFMGQDINITFKFVNNIPPSKSGKHLYTICLIE